jgi:hypothetical protein
MADYRPPRELSLKLELLCGPTGENSEAQLRRAWTVYGEELCRPPGRSRRPWGWWHFEAGREEHLTP